MKFCLPKGIRGLCHPVHPRLAYQRPGGPIYRVVLDDGLVQFGGLPNTVLAHAQVAFIGSPALLALSSTRRVLGSLSGECASDEASKASVEYSNNAPSPTHVRLYYNAHVDG